MRYFCMGYVFKWFDMTNSVQVRILFSVKGGRIPLLGLNELGKMPQTIIIPSNIANKNFSKKVIIGQKLKHVNGTYSLDELDLH